MGIFPEASASVSFSSPPVVYLIRFNYQLGHKQQKNPSWQLCICLGKFTGTGRDALAKNNSNNFKSKYTSCICPFVYSTYSHSLHLYVYLYLQLVCRDNTETRVSKFDKFTLSILNLWAHNADSVGNYNNYYEI